MHQNLRSMDHWYHAWSETSLKIKLIIEHTRNLEFLFTVKLTMVGITLALLERISSVLNTGKLCSVILKESDRENFEILFSLIRYYQILTV